MTRRVLHLAIAGTLAAMAMAPIQARADFELIYEPTPNNGAAAAPGTFVYSAAFNTQLDAGTGQPAETLTSGSFVTLYDVPGLINFALDPAFASRFTLTSQSTGMTPSGIAPPDSSAPNLTLVYNGPTLSTTTFFTNVFSLTSQFTGTAPGAGYFSGQDTKGTGPSAGSSIGSIGRITQPAAATPEPASLVMLAIGLVGVGATYRSRRRA